MNYKKGTNQYKNKYHYPLGLTKNCYHWVLYIIILMLSVSLMIKLFPPKIISPLPETFGFNPDEIFAKEPDYPTWQNITRYIIDVFEPEGKDVVVKAINCFYSESGLRAEAYNYNKNGSEDRGVAQINSIHGLTPAQAHDYKINIQKAYKIYKSRGNFSAWYGKGCK